MADDPRISRARALIGVPFRLHGRDPRTGLDCVGLIGAVHERSAEAPTSYSLRTTQITHWISMLDAFGPRAASVTPGSTLLLHAGPAQLHLGLWTGFSLIHADASLRRVVETPGELRWPLLGVWSFSTRIQLHGDSPSHRGGNGSGWPDWRRDRGHDRPAGRSAAAGTQAPQRPAPQ